MSTVVEHVAWPPPAVHRHPPHQHGHPHVQPHARPLVAAPATPKAALLAAPKVAAPSSTTPTTSATTTAVLLPLRIFLAAGWLRAGIEKSIDHTWWNGGKLRGFLTDHHDVALPFFRPVMEHVFAPYAIVVTLVVIVTEIMVGVAMAIGRSMRVALQAGVALNVLFIFCGQVNPSAFYLVMEIALLFAMADGVIGMRPSPANRRTLVHAGIATVHGLALAPYVRTIDPAKVIGDPAMMLVFLSFTSAATMGVRWIIANAEPQSASRTWTARCSDWAHARRRTLD
jgi:uncharacterized membrane protein YphA (DoxX/SURF4 family)